MPRRNKRRPPEAAAAVEAYVEGPDQLGAARVFVAVPGGRGCSGTIRWGADLRAVGVVLERASRRSIDSVVAASALWPASPGVVRTIVDAAAAKTHVRPPAAPQLVDLLETVRHEPLPSTVAGDAGLHLNDVRSELSSAQRVDSVTEQIVSDNLAPDRALDMVRETLDQSLSPSIADHVERALRGAIEAFVRDPANDWAKRPANERAPGSWVTHGIRR